MSTIIHCIPAIHEESSGPSYSVVRLCQSLPDVRGDKVVLATLRSGASASGLPFVHEFPRASGLWRLGRSPEMYQWLSRVAASGEAALIHNHSLWMMPNVYSGWAASKARTPYVVSPRGTLSAWAMSSGSGVKRFFWLMVQRPSLKSVTCFHATAMAELEDIRRMGFTQPVAVIPNGIDVPPLPERSVGQVRTLLFLGRIHPIKGLDLLLSAWGIVQGRFPDWNLRLVGPDADGHALKLRAMAERLGLSRVEFREEVRGEDKWAAYRAADLFVLPSYSENFGVSVAEALASGIPAIVSKGAPWSGLESNRAGWWVDTSIEGMVDGLERAMGMQPSELVNMGRNGRRWMERDFSWAQVASQMSDTYRWILGEVRFRHS